jgi:hypothetical protein
VDENVMGILPTFVLGSLFLTFVAMPVLAHPIVAMEEGFDRITDLQV